MAETSMIGYWFSTRDCVIRHEDGRKAEIGITHAVDGELALYRNGLHACATLLDALGYAPGPVAWKVKLSSPLKDGGEFIARSRTYLAGGVDITPVLQSFARRVALDVVGLWDAPEVVKTFLHTGDETLRDAARRPAGYSIWAIGNSTLFSARDAWAAAENAIGAATRDAAGAVQFVRYAEQNACYAKSARDSTQDAVTRRYNMWLTEMVEQFWSDGTVQKEW